jgi:DNA-directed RNA polymerase specialized sigma24 family protein
MPHTDSTCWTVIRAAAAGSEPDREELARRYIGVVRAYLVARWRGTGCAADVEDAVQEVLIECFRQGGVVDAAATGRVNSFRGFLFGVVRNVAKRFESRPACLQLPLSEIESDEQCQSQLFERTWARNIMQEAAQRQKQWATGQGAEALQRVELLRLRFEQNQPIRVVAAQWGVPASHLHHAYALARREFKAALLEVVAFHYPGTPAEVEQEASSLLRALG